MALFQESCNELVQVARKGMPAFKDMVQKIYEDFFVTSLQNFGPIQCGKFRRTMLLVCGLVCYLDEQFLLLIAK